MSETETLERPAPGTTGKPSLNIERDTLLAAIRAVGQVVETRNTIPIVSNLLLEASDGTLRIRGTDLDMLAEIEIDATVFGPFATTADAGRLQSAVETMRPGLIAASLDHGVLLLTQRRANRRLPTLPADQFPVIQLGNVEASFEIGAQVLLGLLDATQGSISTEELRYYLNGVFLHAPAGERLVAASTDGHRLSRAIADLPEGAASMPDIILARKGVNLIRRLLGDAEEGDHVPVQVTATKLEVRHGRFRLVAKLIDGTFPDYTRVIPYAKDRRLEVHSAEWARAMKAAAAVMNQRTRGVRLDLDAAEVKAIGSSPEGGQAVEPLDASYEGPALTIGVNAAYAAGISDMFGEAATLRLDFSDAAGPILITSPDRPALTAVLMPMHA
jgi:DNA polymerase III subunit beta